MRMYYNNLKIIFDRRAKIYQFSNLQFFFVNLANYYNNLNKITFDFYISNIYFYQILRDTHKF